ncbi:hypothetical protein K437DRAFT_248317 [Tilletiaria anomala UBC 951]|uniref:Uncharacterized protein n=1 Tax=Tilletiaria anomala (strain ATCC 24038 / CBS 436.72 / UBC 951) TaxID=1037660 RepID=A0A066VTQ6_TILAU|nr:uncharacterized protein K437DRAFT_248317 [Tilletiaria anomala UBC 951]KDN43668.1 hypothetical protein K437DRAFT_248317 [Tilletiaria anomala UBC 951]
MRPASLASKGSQYIKDSFQSRTKVTSDESNVHEPELDEFLGASVSIGHTGQTGGGTNAKMIPSEEGGDVRSQRPGTGSDSFEGEGRFGGQEERNNEKLVGNPGGFDEKPHEIDHKRHVQLNEPVPKTEDQHLDPEQAGTARSHTVHS